jgi:hypothetical protein
MTELLIGTLAEARSVRLFQAANLAGEFALTRSESISQTTSCP